MKKRGLFLSLLSTVIFLSLILTFNPGALLAQQNTGGNPDSGQPENILPDGPENPGQPPSENNDRRGGKMKPPAPPMLYVGYAVKSEGEFETACANFFPPPPESDKKNKKEGKLKKPDGTIEIGKETYFIVEAKIERQDASQQLFPEEAKKAGLKPPAVIKSCSAKISSTYFEMPEAPPAPGQGDQMKMPEGKANIIGDINLTAVEKEAGKRKLILMNGSININGEKYNLYLEPRIMPAQHRGGGKGPRGGEQKHQQPQPPQQQQTQNDNQPAE
jgi:hypothetical protein